MGILSSIFGRASAAVPQVRSVGEHGFVDLDLPLAEVSDKESGTVRFVTRGAFDNEMLGFAVDVHSEWKAQPLQGADAVFYWGAVTLRSIGPASDAFIRLVARLYGRRIGTPHMLAEIKAQAVGLNSDPRKIKSTPVHMKLFFHSDIEDRYAEVFLNVDAGSKVVQFHEKDEDYRVNVIRALTEST